MNNKAMAIGMAVMMGISMTACGSSSGAGGSSAASTGASSASEATVSSSSAVQEDSVAVSSVSKEDTSDAEMLDWEKELIETEGYEPSGDAEETWGFVHIGFTDEFCGKLKTSMEEYVSEHYPNVTLNIGDGKVDVNTQIQLAENFITQGVDVLMLIPSDSAGTVSICEKAHEAGIPMVAITAEPSCEDVDDHAFIGSDHYVSGELQAEYLIDNVDDSETLNICYLGGTEGFTHTTLRRQGFFETLDNAGYNYNLLSDLEGEYLRDKGMEITEDWITKFGDQIDCIVAANDEMALGALNALKAAGKEGVVICGIDCNDDAKEAIANGEMACSVFQNGTAQAKWGSIVAYAAGQGKDYGDVSVPYELVTAENLDQYM